MNDDEQVFDYIAAAEDTGKQLDDLIKAIPGKVREALATEYRQSPWLTTLPQTADRVTAAAEQAEAAAKVLERKATIAGSAVCFFAVVLPLLAWGNAYWQTEELREVQISVKAETERLQAVAEVLKDETGGVDIAKDGQGKWYVALPLGAYIDTKGYYQNGRYGFTYTLRSTGQ